ncbi:hypothetical protein EAE96_003014 [Botrytis aclada]|nr:hypothetical protein EAE96_003014 [Botrytis aclada]
MAFTSKHSQTNIPDFHSPNTNIPPSQIAREAEAPTQNSISAKTMIPSTFIDVFKQRASDLARTITLKGKSKVLDEKAHPLNGVINRRIERDAKDVDCHGGQEVLMMMWVLVRVKF